jgi:hypothetical protein
MTAVLASAARPEQAAPGAGGRIIVGCLAHLPGQVSVIAAGPPGQRPAGPAPASTQANRPRPVTRAVRP